MSNGNNAASGANGVDLAREIRCQLSSRTSEARRHIRAHIHTARDADGPRPRSAIARSHDLECARPRRPADRRTSWRSRERSLNGQLAADIDLGVAADADVI